MIRPGLEPGAFCVLDRCDNQLRHRTVDKGSVRSYMRREPRVSDQFPTLGCT